MTEKLENYWYVGRTATGDEVWKYAARTPRNGLPPGIKYVRDEDVPAAIRPDTDGVADVWITLDQIDPAVVKTTI